MAGPRIYAYVGGDPLNNVDPSGLAGFGLGGIAATLKGKASSGYGLIQQAQFAPAGPLAVPLPPVFLPGTPANNDFVNSTIQAGRAIGNAIGSIFNSENADEPPQLKDMKPLSNGEIRSLQDAGVDPHDLKAGLADSRADLFKDKQGNIFVGGKRGVGEPYPTGLNIKDYR